MPAASDTQTPKPVAETPSRREPVLFHDPQSMGLAADRSTASPAPGTEPGLTASPLPASIAKAFVAAQYSMQNSLQNDAPAEEDAGLLPRLYASRIGAQSQAYYLAQFKRFDVLNRSLPSWNMAAAFFTLAWCSLRGLWREAGQYLAAITAVALIWWFGLRPALPSTMALGLGAALWLVAVAIPGLLGNGWYWRKVRQQTLQAIADSPNMAQAHTALQAQAAPPPQKSIALMVLALPLAAAAGAGLALLPSRQAEPEPAPPALIPASAPEPVTAPASGASGSAQTAPVAAAEPWPTAPQAEPVPHPASEAAPTNTQPEAPSHPISDLMPGKFYLNVGVFSDPANAAKAVALLEKSRLPVLRQTLPSNKDQITRLRSGPFDSRKRAEKAMRKLQASDLQPAVFQVEGDKHAP